MSFNCPTNHTLNCFYRTVSSGLFLCLCFHVISNLRVMSLICWWNIQGTSYFCVYCRLFSFVYLNVFSCLRGFLLSWFKSTLVLSIKQFNGIYTDITLSQSANGLYFDLNDALLVAVLNCAWNRVTIFINAFFNINLSLLNVFALALSMWYHMLSADKLLDVQSDSTSEQASVWIFTVFKVSEVSWYWF